MVCGLGWFTHGQPDELQKAGNGKKRLGMVTNDMVSGMQFSAANGYLRIQLSDLKGAVVSLPPASTYLAENLSAINGRSPGLYDFSGTGIDAANDADPGRYEIDTGTLTLTGMAVDDQVNVNGFVRPFGEAPADFTAQTVVNTTP